MARTPDLLPLAEKQQRLRATDPALHAWVAANAGSGKTSILRNRVIRLLLSGAAPDRILCLTYTKAAAAEMQNRIFEELARWVGLDDAALDEAIGAMLRPEPGPAGFTPPQLEQARTLFARAIETPGGLKIQTIHAFAERILRLFPLESGVPLNFEILDEASAQGLLEEARQAILARSIRDSGSPLGQAFQVLLDSSGLGAFEKTLTAATGLLAGLAIRGETLPPPEGREASLRRVLGLLPGEGPDEAVQRAWDTLPSDQVLADWQAMARGLNQTKGRDSIIAAIDEILAGGAPEPERRFETLLDTIRTDKDLLSKQTLSDAQRRKAPALAAGLEALIGTFRTARQLNDAFPAIERSLALMTFAESVHGRYEALKQARNALDFNDLIGSLRRLVRSGHAGWIMMKLDASIDHILVDEAQDTTPDMWEILKALTEEFFAGEGGVTRPRSLFVVGDEKQSIFSFQGANPAEFEAARQHFGDLARAKDPIRSPVPLNYSFRTSPDLLELVDRIFAHPEFRSGVALSGEAVAHQAAWPDFPGEAEIWPIIRPPIPDLAPAGPRQPPEQMLAEKVAGTIRGWIDSGQCHQRDGKPIEPGDVLILVRERGPFFEAMLRALKRRGLPVAGADRLTLQDHIAVQDLLVVAEAVLSPGHDLALATALRSPLFGVDEPVLEAVARGRPGLLWDAVQAHPALGEVAGMLGRLARQARRIGPYAFLAGLLGGAVPDGSGRTGRQALEARLGSDMHEPVDALLQEAQAFESRETASLMLFLLDQRKRSTQIKRDMDSRSDLIRVMTVHGSKGLEGRVVFLCDTMRPPKTARKSEPILLRDATGPLLGWLGSDLEKQPGFDIVTKEIDRKQREEARRLFYVAMTRASDRLILGGFNRRPPPAREIKAGQEHPMDDADRATWYQMAREGFTRHPRVVVTPDPDAKAMGLDGLGRSVMRIPPAHLPSGGEMVRPASRGPGIAAPATLPGWLLVAPPAEEPPPGRLVPSGLAGPEQAGPEREAGPLSPRERGILLHRLFEMLATMPEPQRADAGRRWVERAMPQLDAAAVEPLLNPVLAMLAQPDMAFWFAPGSRAEAAIAGLVRLADGETYPVEARLDRLRVTEGQVAFLDIKSGWRGERIGAGILRQMAVYANLLEQLYPQKAVTGAILWMRTMTLEPLDPALLRKALAEIPPPTQRDDNLP
ncbi:double-strand break repair helicase AddA [Rhabdaerophilum sp. SD176]|uniref:double-strand break repair helicase AddA n=1 Tax=Rhabdaerophilum sp. SD176 TaxID=2983548 RepID=UPI0024DF85C1|nr:double-strand break repair helicase AddA [Rhabdaerophilum sp. SD176]